MDLPESENAKYWRFTTESVNKTQMINYYANKQMVAGLAWTNREQRILLIIWKK